MYGCLSSCRAVRPPRGVLKGCLPRLDLVSLSGGVCVCLRARSPRLTRPSQRQWRSVVKQAGEGSLRSVLRHIPACRSLTLTTIAYPTPPVTPAVPRSSVDQEEALQPHFCICFAWNANWIKRRTSFFWLLKKRFVLWDLDRPSSSFLTNQIIFTSCLSACLHAEMQGHRNDPKSAGGTL